MKQRKWLRRAAKALVLAMVLSLTLCVTAHAENGWGRLYIQGVDTSKITVTVENLLKTYTDDYYEGYKFPAGSKITVHFGQDVDAHLVSHFLHFNTKISYYEITRAGQETADSFYFVWTALGEHHIHIGATPIAVDPADSGNTDSGNTDSGNTDSGNTDSGNTDSGNTDSGNTDPADKPDSGNTDPADKPDSGNTDPADKPDPGKTDPGKDDPSNPGNPADPADPGKPADPSKPSTGDTMLITLWAVVLMGTAIGITALVRKKKNA